MLLFNTSFTWKDKRLGLTIIAVSLLVMIFITLSFFQYQQELRGKQIKTHGDSLTYLLSKIPMMQLLPDNGKPGELQRIHNKQANPDFLYGVVVDTQGKTLSEISISGVMIPNAPLSLEPSSWQGQRMLKHPADGRNILEFHAPLIANKELMGYIRLGFIQPSFSLTKKQFTFLSTLIVPIILLAIMFYFLMRQEIKPLSAINREIKNNIDRGNLKKIKIKASGNLAGFIRFFNNTIDLTEKQIKNLESSQLDLQTSSKVLFYKHEQIKAVLQALPDGVAILDEEGVISFANEKLTTMLDIKENNILEKKSNEYFTNPKLLTFLAQYEGKTTALYSNESVIFEPDNDKNTKIETKVYPLFSPKDKLTIFGSLIIFKDVTQEAFAKTNSGEFIVHLAHELKTPLNVLSMYSEALLGEDGKEESFRVEAVNVIYDEVERLASLINNLLNLTKIEMGSMRITRTRVKLLQLLQDIFDNVSHSDNSKSINFKLNLPTTISSVSVDKNLLRIAINNLLTNAIKYNHPEGKVSLLAEETDDRIIIRVKDSGIGISEKDKVHIFEKFYRSEDEEVRQRTGHGLGLALTKDIIQLHHGTLSVESTVEEGSEFIIEFVKDISWVDKVI